MDKRPMPKNWYKIDSKKKRKNLLEGIVYRDIKEVIIKTDRYNISNLVRDFEYEKGFEERYDTLMEIYHNWEDFLFFLHDEHPEFLKQKEQ